MNDDAPPLQVSPWTPINKLPIRSRTPPSPSPMTSTTVSSNSILTDDQILNGGLALLTGENLLQVAKTHTNKEIVAEANARHISSVPVLTDKTLGLRLSRTITSVAEEKGITRESLRKEIDDARDTNGVTKRKYAMIGATSKAAKAAKKTDRLLGTALERPLRRLLQRTATAEEDEELSETSTPGELAGEEQEEESAALRAECDRLLAEDPAGLQHDRLFKIAGVYTNSQILAKVKALHPTFDAPARLLSERLYRATKMVADREGKTREEVRAELDATRRANGVVFQKSSWEKRKAVKAEEDPDAMDVDEGAGAGAEEGEDESDDGEDPMGDLEEMERRVDEGELQSSASNSSGAAPEPFDGRPVGYLAGDATRYVPGFRVYP